MNAKEKQQHANELLELYGSLLTNKQKSIMKDKYQFDLSLQEISEQHHISRAAVLDCIKQATDKLNNYENKLHLRSKKEQILKLIVDKDLKKKIDNLF